MRGLVIGAMKGDARSLMTLFRLAEQTGEFDETHGDNQPLDHPVGHRQRSRRGLTRGRSIPCHQPDQQGMSRAGPADNPQRLARRQGGALADRAADPVCAQRPHPQRRRRSTRSPPRSGSGAGPIRCWSTRTARIIAGHGRVLAARKLGMTEVPVMVATGWTEAQKRAYVIADNKLALNAGWDEELLGARARRAGGARLRPRPDRLQRGGACRRSPRTATPA